MIPEHRRAFAEQDWAERHAVAAAAIQRGCGGPLGFRLAESPIFVPTQLVARMDAAARAMIAQVQQSADWRAAVRRRVPADRFFGGDAPHPTFVQVDFALAKGPGGEVVPRLTELQGFPSIYAFQDALARTYRDAYAIPESLTHLAGGLDRDGLRALLGRAILGRHAPETVALVDVHPWTQGTWPDFTFTQALLPGLGVACLTELRRRGRKLFRVEDGREIPVERIYWRVVWDDLHQHREKVTVRLDEDLDVEWANQPNDFLAWSKVALPFLDHPCAPRAQFLDEEWPDDLERWVLKPLFSFSGRGLLLDVDRAALQAVPEVDRPAYVLQERFEYADILAGPAGPIRAEVRMMYVWLEDDPVLVTLMPRLSGGRIMGCQFNRTDPWTGHGVAFWPAE
jgi:hypothetical protein